MSKVRFPQLHDGAWLRRRYDVDLCTLPEMASEIGCSMAAVIQALRRAGVASRSAQQSAKLRGTVRTRTFPVLADADQLRRWYVDEALSIPEIAERVGCSDMPIHRALKRHDIPRRAPGQIREGHRRSDATLGHDDQGRPLRMYHNGYVKVYAPDHPKADRHGCVSQHRLVAEEQMLHRHLLPGEVVHHEKARNQNESENLRVFASRADHARYHQEQNRNAKS